MMIPLAVDRRPNGGWVLRGTSVNLVFSTIRMTVSSTTSSELGGVVPRSTAHRTDYSSVSIAAVRSLDREHPLEITHPSDETCRDPTSSTDLRKRSG